MNCQILRQEMKELLLLSNLTASPSKKIFWITRLSDLHSLDRLQNARLQCLYFFPWFVSNEAASVVQLNTWTQLVIDNFQSFQASFVYFSLWGPHLMFVMWQVQPLCVRRKLALWTLFIFLIVLAKLEQIFHVDSTYCHLHLFRPSRTLIFCYIVICIKS